MICLDMFVFGNCVAKSCQKIFMSFRQFSNWDREEFCYIVSFLDTFFFVPFQSWSWFIILQFDLICLWVNIIMSTFIFIFISISCCPKSSSGFDFVTLVSIWCHYNNPQLFDESTDDTISSCLKNERFWKCFAFLRTSVSLSFDSRLMSCSRSTCSPESSWIVSFLESLRFSPRSSTFVRVT